MVTFITHFCQYLLGTHFTLRTDHGSLTWLRNFKHPEGQLARWLEKLEEYSFTIEHRPGLRHGNADALSRKPDDLVIDATTIADNIIEGRTREEIRALQLEDEVIGPMLQAKENDERPPSSELNRLSVSARRLFQLWDRLVVNSDGLLIFVFHDTQRQIVYDQLVIPQSLRPEILEELHASTTLGSRQDLEQVEDVILLARTL